MTLLAIGGAYSAVAALVAHRCVVSRLPVWMTVAITALWPIPACVLAWERWA